MDKYTRDRLAECQNEFERQNVLALTRLWNKQITIDDVICEHGSYWPMILTPAALKKHMLNVCDMLDQVGETGTADDWRARLDNMPAKMNKEAINYVLVAGNNQLKKLKG